jgi:hypothetical protein
MTQRLDDALSEVQQDIAEFILVEPFRVLAEMFGGSSSPSSSGGGSRQQSDDGGGGQQARGGGCKCPGRCCCH